MSITVCESLAPIKHRPPQHGEIFYETKTRSTYYYNRNEEKYIMLTYLDFMGDYIDEYINTKLTPKEKEKKEKRRNCTNCGAPLTYGEVCEYCGTIH